MTGKRPTDLGSNLPNVTRETFPSGLSRPRLDGILPLNGGQMHEEGGQCGGRKTRYLSRLPEILRADSFEAFYHFMRQTSYGLEREVRRNCHRVVLM
jgi:hypothetical protein